MAKSSHSKSSHNNRELGLTIAAPFVQNMLVGAQRQGLNINQYLSQNKISTQILHNKQARIPVHLFSNLTKDIRQQLNDEVLGLLSKPVRKGAFQLMARASLTCDNVYSSFKTCCDFYNLLDLPIKLQLSESHDKMFFSLIRKQNGAVYSPYLMEILLSTVHRLQCWLAGEFIPIHAVELEYEEPWYGSEYRFVFYGASVKFNCSKNTLIFNRRSLALDIVRNISDLKDFLDNVDEKLLAQTRRSSSISFRLRRWIERCIHERQHTPTLEEACQHLHFQPQTLRRHLKKEGASFKQLKQDARRDIAIHLLDANQHSVEQIAWMIGFSESSTFIRSFKSWTGLTPLVYKQ